MSGTWRGSGCPLQARSRSPSRSASAAFWRARAIRHQRRKFGRPPTGPASAASAGGVERVGRVRPLLANVAGRPVDGRPGLVPGRAHPALDLRPVVAGVNPAPPEAPAALPPQPAEEVPLLEPPGRRAAGELRYPPPRQPDVLVEVRPGGRRVAG